MFYPINLNNHPAILALGISTLIAFAAAALPQDVDQPIHITGDTAEIDEPKGLIHYRGNVNLNQGTMVVNASSMTIEVKNEKVVMVTARGSKETGPARYQQKLRTDDSDVFADADKIIYHMKKDFIELIGNAHLVQNENTLSGENISYDVKAGRVKASSGKSAQVQTTFESASKKE